MFSKTLHEYVVFHWLLWAGMFRVGEELLSWPRVIDDHIVTSGASMSYNREKEEPA